MEMMEAVKIAGRSLGKFIEPCGYEERVFDIDNKEVIVNILFFTVQYTDADFTEYRMHTFVNGKEVSGTIFSIN